jgi:hypothetical protein
VSSRSFVDEEDRTHRATVPKDLVAGLGLPEDDLEGVVRESFAFLLEREPASSIMTEFSLDVIPNFFPEYKEELPERLYRAASIHWTPSPPTVAECPVPASTSNLSPGPRSKSPSSVWNTMLPETQ